MSQAPLHAEAAGAGSRDAAEPSTDTSRWWRTPAGVAILVATAVGLGLRLLQFVIPGHLLGVTEYDDGVYLGASIRLIDGVMPYRDFVLVQPPGVVLLMAPVAALGKLTGTDWAMGIGRLLTACAGGASVLLAGLLVRRRGLLAVIITCGIMAVYPDAILAARTVLQEPWLVLACLAGLLALFDDERLTTSGKRLAWGGVAFGFAGAIKLWAIFPIVVIAVMCAPSLRRAATYLGGVVAGFAVPVLPFFAAAPSSFYRGVFLAQLVRQDDVRTTLTTRLADLSGIISSMGIAVSLSPVVAVLAVLLIVVLALGSCVAASRLTPHPPPRASSLPPPLETFALVTGAVVFLAFLWPVDFYYHYAGFFAPFLALGIALPVARLVEALRPVAQKRWSGPRLDRAALILAGLALFGMFVAQVTTEASAAPAWNPGPAASRLIPPGACVLTDQVSMTIVAGRFTSSVPGCPQIVDGFGTDLDLSRGRNGDTGAARTAAVRHVWDNAFRHAQYVWLSSRINGTAARRIAWTPWLRAYFAANFRPVHGLPHLFKRV
jgi:uncharacterized membrane protein YiaA